MTNYRSFHCTVRGYSHILKNTCCEDASCCVDEDDIHIAVVSDGHGDPACFRSQIGSRLAVEIAAEKLLSFARNIREQGWEERLFDEVSRERLLRQLIRSIIGHWNLKIAEELDANPISEAEFAVSRSYEAAYRAGRELPHIFGCTLIAAMVTDRYLLVLHQGDGRCVVIHRDGSADQPVPWDERCEGNICTSLCHEDAVDSCRYYVADLNRDSVVACFTVSDGIEDSVDSQEDLNAFLCNMASIFSQEGPENLVEQLEDYLPRMSQTGSADDMSVAAIVREDISEDMTRMLSLVYELSAHQSAMRSADGRVRSMTRKADFLRDAMDQAQAEYDHVARALNENLSVMERLKQELRRVIHARDNQALILEAARKKLDEARDAYETYYGKRQSFADKARASEEAAWQLRQELDALMAQMPRDPGTEEPVCQAPDWELEEPLLWDAEESGEAEWTDPDHPKEAARDVPAQEAPWGTEDDFC